MDFHTAQNIVRTAKFYINNREKPSFGSFCKQLRDLTGFDKIVIQDLLQVNGIREETWKNVDLYFQERRRRSKT